MRKRKKKVRTRGKRGRTPSAKEGQVSGEGGKEQGDEFPDMRTRKKEKKTNINLERKGMRA